MAAMLPTTAREAAAFWTFIAATGITTWVLATRRVVETLEAVGRRRVCIFKTGFRNLRQSAGSQTYELSRCGHHFFLNNKRRGIKTRLDYIFEHPKLNIL
jgi:hypothetical protein